eukprot:scaffold46824_cov48-Phaeocystis_antarctica.AAC.1
MARVRVEGQLVQALGKRAAQLEAHLPAPPDGAVWIHLQQLAGTRVGLRQGDLLGALPIEGGLPNLVPLHMAEAQLVGIATIGRAIEAQPWVGPPGAQVPVEAIYAVGHVERMILFNVPLHPEIVSLRRGTLRIGPCRGGETRAGRGSAVVGQKSPLDFGVAFARRERRAPCRKQHNHALPAAHSPSSSD